MNIFSKIIATKYQEPNINEMVGILLASACLAYACGPIIKGVGERIAKSGDKKDGATFWDWLISRNKKDDEPKDEPKKDKPKKDDKELNNAFNSLLLLARKANQKEKDENTKKKNDALVKLLTACSFDKDGNEIPLEERIDKMKDSMTPEQFESFKKDMTETYEKVKDDDKFKDAIKQAKSKITPEQYDELIEEAKKEASETLTQLEKEKKEIEDYEKQVDELEKKIQDASGKDKEELEKKLQQTQQNPPQTMMGTATGVSSVQTGNNNNDDDSSKDEKSEKSVDDIKKEFEQKSKDLEKEYQEKIDKESDKDKKEELEKEWIKKENALNSAKHKAMDSIDDNDEHDTEKNETKDGKYTVKDEEITDPETGKKIKVKTYTGPRGGKFYYPNGKPKNSENKVYISESFKKYTSLSSYLYRSIE